MLSQQISDIATEEIDPMQDNRLLVLKHGQPESNQGLWLLE